MPGRGRTAPLWARVGGGFEDVDTGDRHGPADLAFPPAGAWTPVMQAGRLVGWTKSDQAGTALARHAAEAGRELERARRSNLLGRLGHKLRSSVLSLQETARQAAFGRPELLEQVFEGAQEVGRRAAALEAASLDPKDAPRSVVVAALLRSSAPGVVSTVPPEAVVAAPETVLHEALTRTYEWMGGPGAKIDGEFVSGQQGGWWRLRFAAAPEPPETPMMPEMGEGLVSLLVDIHCDGWLHALPGAVEMWLHAAREGGARRSARARS